VPATKQCSTYHVRCPDGTEHGPFSRGELESLAAAGELTADCLLCEGSTHQWKRATEYPFLRGRCQMPAPEKAEAAFGIPPRPVVVGIYSNRLGDEGIRFTPASAGIRLAAGITDLLLLAVWGVAAAALCGLLAGPGAPPRAAAVLWLAAWYAGSLLYFTACLTLRGQTLGQWFWGLMTCTADLRELWADRAFVAAATMMGLGFFLLPTALFRPQARSLADEFSGTRVIRTRILPSHVERILP
jgi:uncharacterized RDD family membrane protein YckC